MNSSKSSLQRQHISTKVFKSYIFYIKQKYPHVDIEKICESSGLGYNYLLDETHAVSVEFDYNFTKSCVEITEQSDLCYQVGLSSLSPEIMGKPLYFFVRTTQTCESLYQTIEKYTSIYNKTLSAKCIELGPGCMRFFFKVQMERLDKSDINFVKEGMRNLIENTRGTLSAVPKLFQLPLAEVTVVSAVEDSDALEFTLECKFETAKRKAFRTALHIGCVSVIYVLITALIESRFPLSWTENSLIFLLFLAGLGMTRGVLFFRTMKGSISVAQEYSEKLDTRYRQLQLSNEMLERSLAELNDLRLNLEIKVDEKTRQLVLRTQELENSIQTIKKAEAAIIQQEKLATLGTVAALLAHEINNSMHYTSSSASQANRLVEALPDGEIRTKLLKLISMISEGAAVTIEVVENIRNYAGVNNSKYGTVRIANIVQSTLRLLTLKFQENGSVNISVHVDVEEGLELTGSSVGFYQIFMNLVGNALEAMPSGGTLYVSAKTVRNFCEIKCKDTGVGIMKGDLSEIFKPFFTTKGTINGSGLGLHIVMTEVQRHKGKIEVASEVGMGAEFTILIPKNLTVEEGELV